MRTSALFALVLFVAACQRAAPPAPACSCPPVPVAAVTTTTAQVAAPPPPHRARTFALHVLGDESNEDKRGRCRDRVHALGAHLDAHAPVQVSLTLSAQNRIEIRSASRGVVLREPLGHDPIFDLCTELTTQALAALGREPRDG